LKVLCESDINFDCDLKEALNPSRCSQQLREQIKKVFDFEESGTGSLYHYCCLLGDGDHGKWHAYIVKKNLKIPYSADPSQTSLQPAIAKRL